MLKAGSLLITFFCLIFWPIGLFIRNTFPDFINYAIPTASLVVSFFLYASRSKFYLWPSLIIPIIEPKLALFPVILGTISIIYSRSRINIIYLAISLTILVASFKQFYGQTIFIPDYQARQQVIRDTHLYPSVFVARLFHNKIRIVMDKTASNFFALTDINNYFFGFHPRQIPGNQNLNKYFFPAFLPFLAGVIHFNKNKYRKLIVMLLIAGLISLSVLSIFDRNDFVIWLPISIVITDGIKYIRKSKYKWIYLLWFVVFLVPETIRLFTR